MEQPKSVSASELNDNDLIKTLYELLHNNKHLNNAEFEARLNELNEEAEKRKLL